MNETGHTTDESESDSLGTAGDAPDDEPGSEVTAPDTDDAIRDLAIGAELRRHREALGISLRELARRVSVSASLVSQVERGLAMPSVSTLYSIVRVLDLSLDQLFQRESAPLFESGLPSIPPFEEVAHYNERPVIRLADGISWERLAGDHDSAVEMIHSVYAPGSESCPVDAMIRHRGRETGFVIQGQLTVNIGFKTVILGPGDTVSFESTTPHRLANEGTIPVRAVWLTIESPRGDG